jgi:hypothetical protein
MADRVTISSLATAAGPTRCADVLRYVNLDDEDPRERGG